MKTIENFIFDKTKEMSQIEKNNFLEDIIANGYKNIENFDVDSFYEDCKEGVEKSLTEFERSINIPIEQKVMFSLFRAALDLKYGVCV